MTARAGAQYQLGLNYANAMPTFTLAHTASMVAARTLPPQYAAAAQGGVPRDNLTDATVYAPIKAAIQPLLAAASAQVGWGARECTSAFRLWIPHRKCTRMHTASNCELATAGVPPL